MILIGISGKKQSGKDEVCKMISELAVQPVQRLAFADALKEEVAKACGVTVAHIELNKTQFRPVLQWWGTDFRRASNDKYWLDEWVKRGVNRPSDTILVAPDVRFKNEADLVRWLGGILIRVERKTTQHDSHLSETALDEYKFDYTITNDSTLNNLRHDVQRLLHNLKIKTK